MQGSDASVFSAVTDTTSVLDNSSISLSTLWYQWFFFLSFYFILFYLLFFGFKTSRNAFMGIRDSKVTISTRNQARKLAVLGNQWQIIRDGTNKQRKLKSLELIGARVTEMVKGVGTPGPWAGLILLFFN